MRYLFILTIVLFLFACGKDQAHHDHSQKIHGMPKEDVTKPSDERLIYYTCPMETHKEVHSARPGQCPECGMELVAGVITTEDKMEYYGCPMLTHSYVRSDTAGTCADCGMELKPMRLVKEKKESI